MSISNILSMVDELTMRNINRVTSKVTKNSSRISLTVSVRGSNPARDKSLRTFMDNSKRETKTKLIQNQSHSPNQFRFNVWSHDLKKDQ